MSDHNDGSSPKPEAHEAPACGYGASPNGLAAVLAVLTPRIDQLTKIWDGGASTALMFLNPDPSGNPKWLLEFKWNLSRVQLRGMTKQEVTRVVNAIDCAYPGDKPVAQWLRRKGARRVLVFTGRSALCLTLNEKLELVVEPSVTSAPEVFS